MESKLPVNISSIDFADSEILSYNIKSEGLTLFVERWNAEILEIKFLKHVAVLAMCYFRIAEAQEVYESPLLERALNELYETIPKEHNFRIFKFITPEEDVALEVVCEDINIRIIKKMVE